MTVSLFLPGADVMAEIFLIISDDKFIIRKDWN
jgi:hypothetical protein